MFNNEIQQRVEVLGDGEERVLGRHIAAYHVSVMGDAREVQAPSQELILQAVRYDRAIEQSEKWTAGMYGGGGPHIVVDDLYPVMGDSVVYDSEECRVISVVEKFTLIGGISIALVIVQKPISLHQHQCYVVPTGVVVRGFRLKNPGHLVRHPLSTVVAKTPVQCFSLDVTHPLMGGNWLFSGISYQARRAFHSLKKTMCCLPDLSVVVRIDDRICHYLHYERLGALSSITSEQAFRILYSSAVKEFRDKTSPDTIKSTCRYFAALNGAPLAYESLSESLIEQKTTAPRIFDPRVTIIDTGGGEIKSELDTTRIDLIDNGLLEVKHSNGATFNNGELTFNTPFEKPQAVFHVGPAVASAVVRYTTRSTQNKSKALMRMTNSRVGEHEYRVNADLTLFHCMCRVEPRLDPLKMEPGFLSFSKAFGAFDKWGLNFKDIRKARKGLSANRVRRMEKLRTDVFAFTLELLDHIDAEEYHFANSLAREVAMPIVADEPHEKRDERMATVESMDANPRLYDPNNWPTYSDGKVKWENGKYNKLSRQYISMFNGCALEWLKMPEVFKHAMAHELKVDGVTLEFVPDPSQPRMDRWARKVAEGLDPGCHENIGWYHSDDSSFSIRVLIAGVWVRLVICIDVKKCDLSHSPGLFVLLAGIIQACGFDHDPIMSLFMQMRKDIRINHPDPRSDEYIIFKTLCILLFTGSVLTTLVNNLASILLLLNIINGLTNPDTPHERLSDIGPLIMSLAKEVGYDVEIESFTILEGSGLALAHTTFLKHFPALSLSGNWVAVKDYATIVRGIGFAEEPINGSQRLREIFCGWNSTHHNPIIDQVFLALGINWPEDPSRETISLDPFVERYGASPQEFLEGFELLTSITRPVFLVHPAFDAILRVGYGLPRLFEREPRLPDPTSPTAVNPLVIDNG